MGEDGGEVLLGPVGEVMDNRHEGLAHIGHGILDTRRDNGIDMAENQSVLLQRAEGAGEHSGRDIGDGFLNLAVTKHTGTGDGQQDQQRPLIAKAGDDIPNRAGSEVFRCKFRLKHKKFKKNQSVVCRKTTQFRAKSKLLSKRSPLANIKKNS